MLIKFQVVKAVLFPVVMYGCESWIVKKVECWRIDAFKLWCWRRLLRVPCTAWRSNQSILKEINPEYFWEDWCWSWTSNTLATWCEELTYLKRPWCWGRLLANGERGDRGWDGWMASLTRWAWVWASSGRQWRTVNRGMLRSTGSQSAGHVWADEQRQPPWWASLVTFTWPQVAFWMLLPWLAAAWICPLKLRGRSWRLHSVLYKRENGRQKVFRFQEPPGILLGFSARVLEGGLWAISSVGWSR